MRGERRRAVIHFAPPVETVARQFEFPTISLALLGVGLLSAAGCSEFVPRETPDTCQSAGCTSGTVHCADGEREICVEATADCSQWQALPCPAEQQCGGSGECGADECTPLGSLQCVGPTGFQICLQDDVGFLSWSEYSACNVGSLCDAGVGCTEIACDEPGVRSCVDGGSFRRCETDPSGLLIWSSPVICEGGRTCAGSGVCGEHECTSLGAFECDGEDGERECVAGPDGFRVLSPTRVCPGMQRCGPGGTCGEHQCGPKGATTCEGNGVIACVVVDGFLVWGLPEACPEDQTCRGDGVCGTDGCPSVGEAECLDGNALHTCELADSGFLSWGAPETCEADAICSGAACVPHECPVEGAVACADNTKYHSCVAGPDGLRQWSEPEPCPGQGSQCKANGLCGKDQCAEEGVTACISGSQLATCASDPSGFLAYGTPVDCPPETSCSGGACGADECELGQTICTDSVALATCTSGPGGFLVFGEPMDCPAGTECFGSGQCAATGEIAIWDKVAVARPDVTALPGGAVAVVWTTTEASAFRVMLRRFDASGLPLEDALDVSGPIGLNLPFPSVAPLPSSGGLAVAVAWLDGGVGVLRVRRIVEPGVLADAAVSVPPTLTLPATPYPVVTRFSAGLVAVLRIEGPANPAQQTVFGAATDGINAPSPAEEVSPGGGAGLAIDALDAAGLLGGGLWATWSETSVDGGGTTLQIRAVPGDGVPKTPPIEVTLPKSTTPAEPAIATAGDGSALVVFEAIPPADTDGDTDILGQRVDALGALAGEPFTIPASSNGAQTRPTVAKMAAGAPAAYVVAWEGADSNGSGIFVRLVPKVGDPLATDSGVNLTTVGQQAVPSVAGLTDGRAFVVWRDGVGLQARMVGRYLTTQ